MRSAPTRIATVLALLVVADGELARAYNFDVWARTETQGYQLRRLGRDRLEFLNRRRLTQYLGLRVFNLLDPGQEPYAPGTREPPALMYVNFLMRFGTDFGNFVDTGDSIPELTNNEFDLMFGALEGRNLFGRVDFTLGRQYDMELLDVFAFDGLRVRVNLPLHLFVEALGGIQVIRAHPLSLAVFQTDSATDDGTDDAWQPTAGVAVGLDWPRWASARLAYRSTLSRAPLEANSETSVWGGDQELLFFGVTLELPVIGTRPTVGARYNILLGQLDDLQLMLTQRLGWRHEIQLEYLHSRPHYDGDSIFNIFASGPFNEVAATYGVRILSQLRANARFGYRRLWSDEAEGQEADADAFSGGLGAALTLSKVQAALDLYYLGGHGGRTVGGDLTARWALLRFLALEGRMTLIDFRGVGEVKSDGLNFGLQLGTRVRFIKGIELHVLLEDNISPLYDSALRLLALLDLELEV